MPALARAVRCAKYSRHRSQSGKLLKNSVFFDIVNTRSNSESGFALGLLPIARKRRHLRKGQTPLPSGLSPKHHCFGLIEACSRERRSGSSRSLRSITASVSLAREVRRDKEKTLKIAEVPSLRPIPLTSQKRAGGATVAVTARVRARAARTSGSCPSRSWAAGRRRPCAGT